MHEYFKRNHEMCFYVGYFKPNVKQGLFEFKVCIMKYLTNTIFPIKIMFTKAGLNFQADWFLISG